MAPILQKGLFCCLSLRSCSLILGTINLVGSLITLSMFAIGLNQWLEYGSGPLLVPDTGTAPDSPGLGLAVHMNATQTSSLSSSSSVPSDSSEIHKEHMLHHDDSSDYDIFADSEAMEDLVLRDANLAMVALWLDFTLVLSETLAVILLLWGAAKRIAGLLVPWLLVEVITTLYDIGFFAYLFAEGVYLMIDVLPIFLLPVTVYCWLVVFSLYQECRETASRNASIPLSMSALQAQEAGAASATCSVPYGRMAG